MKKITTLFLATVGGLLLNLGSATQVSTQEATIILAHKDSFGKLQRPPVHFPHDLHVDVLEDEGCGSCHHVFSKEKQGLVPADGEETSCTDCHQRKKEGNVPSLRQAYHGSCTFCHRTLEQEGRAGGPVTCGGCHPKQERNLARR